ncbi:hypothetical protein FORC065_1487 [Yersinia enterocolitica]|nr:hypothetical protein FORC065_1487 [Yersinia enterocolitica]
MTHYEINDKAIDSLVSTGVTVPRGTSVACPAVFKANIDPNGTIPFIGFFQQPDY